MDKAPVQVAPAEEEDPFDLDAGLPVQPEKKKPPQGPDGKFISPEPKHPEHLARQAADFGMDAETIDALSTPALYRQVNLFLTREREISKSFSQQQMLDQNRVKQPEPPVPEPEPPDEFDQALAEGMIEPRIVQLLKSNKKAALAEVKSLKEELAASRQEVATEKMNENFRIVDAAFKKMGDPRLGEGTGIELKNDPAKQAEFRRRIAVLNAAGITDMRQVDRYTIMSKLRAAHAMLFGATVPEQGGGQDAYTAALANASKPNGKFTQEEWSNGGVAKPSQRSGAPEPKGEALAIKNLTERFRDQDSRRTDDEELEGIPD